MGNVIELEKICIMSLLNSQTEESQVYKTVRETVCRLQSDFNAEEEVN